MVNKNLCINQIAMNGKVDKQTILDLNPETVLQRYAYLLYLLITIYLVFIVY
jgi:hypothetical protein